DDDADIRQAVAEVLEGEGHGVVVARDGADALDKLNAGAAPDLVLLDVMMPVMDGPTFLRTVRADARYRDLPVCLFTANAEAARALTAFGIRGCLKKPLSFDELVGAVERYADPA
ncbi:MAG: response regulator, partial [Myxococcales bacterium]